MSNDGLILWASHFDAGQTLARLRAAIATAGLTLFAEIDHAAGAREAGLELRPETLLLFGNPRGGTPLMAQRPTSGIDLPLKALVWEDEHGAGWLAFNAPDWIGARHQVSPDLKPVLDGLAKVQAKLAVQATDSDQPQGGQPSAGSAYGAQRRYSARSKRPPPVR